MNPFEAESFLESYLMALEDSKKSKKKMAAIPVIATISNVFKRKGANTKFEPFNDNQKDDDNELIIISIVAILLIGIFAYIIINKK